MSPSNKIQKPEFVSVRDAFAHEAHGFTRWLETNIDALSSRVGIKFTVVNREYPAGSFNVDLLCEKIDGGRVIVENQLETSDHDHLGKLLTYLVNLNATTAIWVTPDVRTEHQRVVDWLNQSSGDEYAFYLVRVEAIRVDDFTYIPIFTLLSAPDEQTKEIGDTKRKLANRHYQRREFWTQLLEKSKSITKLHSARSPSTDHWLDTGAGKTGFVYRYTITQDSAAVELYIDTENPEKNKANFDKFLSQKDAIESEFGEELDWQRLDDKRAARICKHIMEYGGLTSSDNWPELQDEMIQAMIKLDKAFGARIRKL